MLTIELVNENQQKMLTHLSNTMNLPNEVIVGAILDIQEMSPEQLSELVLTPAMFNGIHSCIILGITTLLKHKMEHPELYPEIDYADEEN